MSNISSVMGSGKRPLNKLTTDELVLFGFITLVIDIKYRVKYGKSLEYSKAKGYTKKMKQENFPGYLPLVEDGLESVVQQGVNDVG